MRILNLTQHEATADQLAVGVVETDKKSLVQMYLTFDELPSTGLLAQRAAKLADIARESGCGAAMIGGAPYFMAPLEVALVRANIKVLYAFSKRESTEVSQPDGSTKKTMVFRHTGFVEVLSKGEHHSPVLFSPRNRSRVDRVLRRNICVELCSFRQVSSSVLLWRADCSSQQRCMSTPVLSMPTLISPTTVLLTEM